MPSRSVELPPLLVIGGPTATGKTGLSLSIADAVPGAHVVSADSRQVFRGMDIGTAKVSAADRARIPHHGIDLADPDEPFTAADFLRHAMAALETMAAAGVPLALLVGGTGLYLRAVARGLPLQETGHDAEVRARLEHRLATEGLSALAAELERVAPGMAERTDLANPRRVVRALERVELSGDRPPPAPRGYPGRVAWLGLDAPTAVQDKWIERRAREQFAAGLLDEAAALATHYDRNLPAFSAFGYREAFDVIDGRATVEQAIAIDARRTHQFARRQRTWFRRERDIEWLDATGDPLPRALRVAGRLVG